MKFRISVAGAVLLLLLVQELAAAEIQDLHTFAVRAGKIFTLSGSPSVPEVIEGGILIVREGKIAAVGRDLDLPPGMRVLEFPRATLIPGLVAAGGFMGSAKPGEAEETASAQFRAVDEFDPYGNYTPYLQNGVTTAYMDPGWTRLIPGQGAVVKVGGAPAGKRVLSPLADVSINLGEEAFKPPPKIRYPQAPSSDYEIESALEQRPETRLGQFLELESQFHMAREYGAGKRGGFDSHLEILSSVLAEGRTFRVHASRRVDLYQAILFIQKMGLRAYLAGATEGHHLKDTIASSGLSVVLEVPVSLENPAEDLGSHPNRVDEALETAAELSRKGVRVALCAPRGKGGAHLMMVAAAAVRGGLSPLEALRAVTRNPAEILNVGDRVGSLTPGRDADFAVLNGSPFSVGAHVEKVFINGSVAFAAKEMEKKREAVVVKAGTVFTAAGPPILNGALLIEDGKIAAVGRTVPCPPYARIIDAGPEACVTPGFIDAFGHLGLNGDKASPASNICPASGIGVAEPNFLDVAKAGVSTVILSPYVPNRSGSQLSAIKTAGKTREDLVLKERAGLVYPFRNVDPLLGIQSLDSLLKSGKDYFDKWVKYYEDLKKWEEEQAKKKEEAGKKPVEAGKEAEEKKAPPKPQEVEEVEKKIDPISGKWAGKISGGRLREPWEIILTLKLEGSSIQGKASYRMAREEVPVSGTLSGNHVVLEIDQETRRPKIEADIDREDHMKGTFAIGQYFILDFEADRVEKEVEDIQVTRKRAKKLPEGKPAPPPVNDSLEPFRPLFEGKAAALVDAGSAPEIRRVIEVFSEKYKVPLVLLNAEEAELVFQELQKAKVGVVVPAQIIRIWNRNFYHQADRLSREGIPVAFQSNAEDGARSLPMNTAFAVRQGMDATEAILALTLYPARMFRIDDRVGTLEKGKDGDLVIFSGDPFEVTSRVLCVLVNGKEVRE